MLSFLFLGEGSFFVDFMLFLAIVIEKEGD